VDPVLLSRIQFAVTIGFHFLFPPLTIGLAWLLVIVEWVGWRRSNPAYVRAGKFFARLLALTFAVGVATGIVMEFQFGTNWARYSKFVGDIFGAPLAAEGVFAFFLESTFLALYLFGRDRVSKRAHWFAILMVAVGATVSAFWILVANSWQQTPAGYVLQNDRAELTSFWEAVFNPSMLPRFFHTLLASLVSGAFFMAGISAFLVLQDHASRVGRACLRLSVVFGFVASVLAAFPTGHEHARQVAHTQPEKFAAIEGLYSTQSSAPLVFFGVVENRPPDLTARVEIPGLLSWMAFGNIDAKIQGINEFPKDDIPPLWMTFVSFHNMVLLGMYFGAVMALGCVLLRRHRIFGSRRFLWLLVVSIPLPLVACQFGWVTAEVGRQPWIVYHLLRTREAHSLGVSAGSIFFSLVLFGAIYALLGALYIYVLAREVRRGPEHDEAAEVA
jgi:cytochrome d ubiquinol oxidase subunit I